MAFISESAALAPKRQQLEPLCPDKGERQADSSELIRQSRKTKVWTTAKLLLNDFLKEQQESQMKHQPPLFSEAVEMFKRDLENDLRLKSSC